MNNSTKDIVRVSVLSKIFNVKFYANSQILEVKKESGQLTR